MTVGDVPLRRMRHNELAQFGVVRTDRMRYAPLDQARITFERRGASFDSYLFEVLDGAGRCYFKREFPAANGFVEFPLTVGGAAGLHIVRVSREDEPGHFRMGSFVLSARTDASAEGTDMADFFRWLGGVLAGSLEWALYGGRWVAGHKAGDNSPMNLAYPLFRLESCVYFEGAEELKSAIELIYAHQKPDGSLYDHIYGDGHPGWDGQRMIRSMMADLEIGLIVNVHQVWMATADTQWMKHLMEPMLRGWRYTTSSPDLWSEEHRLIKRPHTADEWDFQMGDGSNFRNENSKYAIALCDAVRLPKAADALGAMLDALGQAGEAELFREFAAEARKRANALLWDGRKYRHHVHIDAADHGDFDEDAQLVMSNTWACNDGLADHEQSVAIVGEYEKRLAQTGDRYPWWSLQPGYPERHFPGKPPGFYANGGLFPLVGADLCRTCFRHGFETRAWRLFREFWEQVKSDNGACVTWYTLDGHAAANTRWTTNYDGWGIAAWGRAAIEGMVGVIALAPALERCRCIPQWGSGDIRRARACVAMPASRSYFAYDYLRGGNGLTLRFTGSGRAVDFDIPLCAASDVKAATLNGVPIDAPKQEKDGAEYLCLHANINGVQTLRLEK